MSRRLIMLKGLAERISQRQQPPQTVPDREAWQRDYVSRSKAGTDIRSATGQVGDSATSQAEVNAMSPQERMAHLQRVAGQAGASHYHVTPTGQIAWGLGGAGTRPVKAGDKLVAYRGIEKTPTPLRVHSTFATHLGVGMRVIHPDQIHEDMHGQPLHPMHLAGAEHTVPPHPQPIRPRPVLMKSKAQDKKRRRVLAKRKRHSPALGREGRDQRGSDIWYHAGFLLHNDPVVARACGLHAAEVPKSDGAAPDQDSGDAAAAGAGAPLAQSLPDLILAKAWFGGRRHIRRPGSRGGRFYYDQRGEVVYGDRPSPHYREAQVGDHARTSGGYGRIDALGDGTATVGGQDHTPDQIHELAPGHLQGDELSPRMRDASGDESEGATALRLRMRSRPLPGDRAIIDGGTHTVERADAEDVTLTDGAGQRHLLPRQHWDRALDESATPQPPDLAHPRRERSWGDMVEERRSPRQLTVQTMRDAMQPGGEPPPSPTDTSGDYPQRARLREAMRTRPWPGDTVAVTKPLSLDGNDYRPGQGYTAAYVEGGEVELCDTFGNPAGTLDEEAWQHLLDQNAVIPMKRGDPPADLEDLQVPGVGVFGVFGGKVSKEEVRAAWTGRFAGGYATTTDTLAEDVGKVLASGSILDPSGQHVGHFERHIFRNGRGQIHVEHVLMEVFQDMKIGFADDFNRQAEDSYKRWGVSHINVYADISVGKYCWARQGYTWTDADERERAVDRFAAFCKDYGHSVPDSAIVQMQHPWHVAGYTDGPEVRVVGHPRTTGGTDFAIDGTFNLGKAFFLADPATTPHASGAWHGVKRLADDNDPTMRQSRRYRKGKAS